MLFKSRKILQLYWKLTKLVHELSLKEMQTIIGPGTSQQITSDSEDFDPDTTVEVMHLAGELGLVTQPSSRSKAFKLRRYLVQTPRVKSLMKVGVEKIFKLSE